MRRIGHRGAKGHAPENTIASFQKALDLGCDEVETDVSRGLVGGEDQDDGAGRLMGGQGTDADPGPDPLQGGGVAQLGSGPGVGELLARRADPDVYVSSFWWAALESARSAAPSVRRAFLFSDAPERSALFSSARALGLWALHPNRAYLTEELVRDAHREGLRVNVWTVDDEAQIRLFAGWGVDGIMSDYPERIPKT